MQRQGLQTRVHDLRARDRYPDKMKIRQHSNRNSTLRGIARNCAEMRGIRGI